MIVSVFATLIDDRTPLDQIFQFELAAPHPDPWRGAKEYESNSALRLTGDFLSEDFCAMQGRYFMIRCVLIVPVIASGNDYGFGVWSSLSRTNFEKYADNFDVPLHDGTDCWTGWLMNQIKGLSEGNSPIGVTVQPQRGRQRPLLWVQDDNEPLAQAQEQGITRRQLEKIVALYGHEPNR